MTQNFIIPVKNAVAQQRLQVDLSGRTFFLDFTWIARDSSWMFDMYDSALTPLVLCKFLSLGANVLQDQSWDPRLPSGAIGLFTTIPSIEPTYNNFGTSVKLYYREF